MIAHVSLPVREYPRAKEFYAKTLQPLGYGLNMEYGEAAGFAEGGNTSFWIAKKEVVEPMHIAFQAQNKQAVDDFYLIALKSGATDNGAPGYRTEYWPGYYAAFVHDPDGHNIEAVFYDNDRAEGDENPMRDYEP